ncbi:MAG: molybdopterin converting factor subunit 1 [Gemmatimonadota bacterium]|nr:MAG: molybdopterin converting factor subunit 1 [Gemmatimonadota bacterium]
MRVTCLFFAAYRDVFGAEQIELELPQGSTLGALIDDVRARAGDAALPRQLVAAVNREYASVETVLHDGDEVAFIPPVAGG